MRSTARTYDIAAAGLAATLSLVELVRVIIARGVSPGLTTLSTLIGAVAFCFILAAAAVGLILHRQTGWLFGVLGVIAAASHGVIVRAGGSWIGVPYLLASLVLLALLIKSLHWYRTETLAET